MKVKKLEWTRVNSRSGDDYTYFGRSLLGIEYIISVYEDRFKIYVPEHFDSFDALSSYVPITLSSAKEAKDYCQNHLKENLLLLIKE